LVDTAKQRGETQNQDLFDLSQQFSEWLFKHGYEVKYDDVGPDGQSPHDGPTGVINWYITNPQDVTLAQQWVQEKAGQGFQIQVRVEQSNSRSSQVCRLEVIENPTADVPRAPEMHLTYGTWGSILGALNLALSNEAGRMLLSDMQRALAAYNPNRAPEFTRDQMETGGPGEVHMIDFGLDQERLDRNIEYLREMVSFGLRNGYREIGWA
jgi:hypothetical protein